MSENRYVIGIDISTQAITAMLIGVMEEEGSPSELMISSAWMASRQCRDDIDRKTPSTWVHLIRECISDLRKQTREAELAESIGISTTFPGAFTILADGLIHPQFVSLYDNTDDVGISDGRFEELLEKAEADTFNRMWSGTMAIGTAHLVKFAGLRLENARAIVPPNTAFSYALLHSAGIDVNPSELISDFTQTIIGGLYDPTTGLPVPSNVLNLLNAAVPGINWDHLKDILPKAVPSWRNILSDQSLPNVRKLLGLPNLRSVSIGAGDSPLGALALLESPDTIINIRGSSDSPMLIMDSPKPRNTRRETVCHYPLPTVRTLADSPWCAIAPMLRSGKVWDWVRKLRFSDYSPNADAELETMAIRALKRRLKAPKDSLASKPLRFSTALGGERAPNWDPYATGSITGLIEAHDIGDIALAALEGMSITLRQCISASEKRYDIYPNKQLIAGGPTRNALWNWLTQIYTGKKTSVTTFSDASLLGAAMIGYGASFDGREDDSLIVGRLLALSRLASTHPLISPVPVKPPDDECAALEAEYTHQAETLLRESNKSTK